MKQMTAFLLALLLTLSLSATAFADVIYEPQDDFLWDHIEQCTRINRNYRALTEVTVYKSPEDNMAVADALAVGDTVHIYYTYTDEQDNLWGYCENYEMDVFGWVAMAYMELVYDYISFQEDYGHTFLAQEGQLSPEYAQAKVWFWEYPGSESGYEFDMELWGADYMPEYDTVYQDEQGRSWGYVGYYLGSRNFWICLDDPSGDFDTLYPAGSPEVNITRPGESEATLPAEEIVPQASSGTVALRLGVSFAVLGCVAATVVLLVRMKKKEE